MVEVAHHKNMHLFLCITECWQEASQLILDHYHSDMRRPQMINTRKITALLSLYLVAKIPLTCPKIQKLKYLDADKSTTQLRRLNWLPQPTSLFHIMMMTQTVTRSEIPVTANVSAYN